MTTMSAREGGYDRRNRETGGELRIGVRSGRFASVSFRLGWDRSACAAIRWEWDDGKDWLCWEVQEQKGLETYRCIRMQLGGEPEIRDRERL